MLNNTNRNLCQSFQRDTLTSTLFKCDVYKTSSLLGGGVRGKGEGKQHHLRIPMKDKSFTKA